MDYYDRTLIKLKRQYGKDELVASLIKKLSEAEIANGILKDEIDYLKAELTQINIQKEVILTAKIEARKDELYKMQLDKNKRLRETIKKLINQRNDLLYKLYGNNKNN